jgi:hypothetical protein
MEAGKRHRAWKACRNWLLWWKADPAELRHQVEGYGTLRFIASARWFGFLLAAGLAAEAAFIADLTFAPGIAPYVTIAWFETGVAVSLAVLGGLMLRGNRAATILLMAVYSVQTAVVAAYDQNVAFMLVSVVGWAVGMRVFYLSLCVERSRKEAA